MATATKKGSKVRGANPPKKTSKPRGGVSRTREQEEALNELVSKMKEIGRAPRDRILRARHAWGKMVERACTPNGNVKYGKVTTAELQALLDATCKGEATLSRCKLFAQYLTKSEVEELGKMEVPPSWRMMVKWLGIKSEEDRDMVLAKIKSGELTPSNFDADLRRLLKLPPKQQKVPKKPEKRLETVRAALDGMTPNIKMLSDATKTILKYKDEKTRRNGVTVAKATIESMKSAMAQMQEAIANVEAQLDE